MAKENEKIVHKLTYNDNGGGCFKPDPNKIPITKKKWETHHVSVTNSSLNQTLILHCVVDAAYTEPPRESVPAANVKPFSSSCEILLPGERRVFNVKDHMGLGEGKSGRVTGRLIADGGCIERGHTDWHIEC